VVRSQQGIERPTVTGLGRCDQIVVAPVNDAGW
jgi:hypothetical protein